MAKKSNHDIGRIIISLIYIVLGGLGTFWGVKALLGAFSVWFILGLAANVVMLVAGLLGFLNIKPKLCRLLGLIIFVLAVLSFVNAIIAKNFGSVSTWLYLVDAIIAWYFVIWIKGKK